MKTIKYSQGPSGALNIRDLWIGNLQKSGIGAAGPGAVTIKKKDIIKYRVRVVDPLDGRARA
jgi:hypothetical protein